MLNILSSEFSANEVKTTLFQMGPTKTSGTDGMNAIFYQKFWHIVGNHGFQNRTELGGWTVKTKNRDENRFFKPKEPNFLLIPWTAKTEVGPHKPVRTVRSNPLAIKKKKFNIILFYLIKLSIS